MNQEIRERTKWFMDARFGMFIHWGLVACRRAFSFDQSALGRG